VCSVDHEINLFHNWIVVIMTFEALTVFFLYKLHAHKFYINSTYMYSEKYCCRSRSRPLSINVAKRLFLAENAT